VTFDLDDALVVGGARRQVHVEPVTGQQSLDHVAPFDERDSVVTHELLEAEVVQLLDRVRCGTRRRARAASGRRIRARS